MLVVVDDRPVFLGLRSNLGLVTPYEQRTHSGAYDEEGGIQTEVDVERVDVPRCPLGDE